MITEVIYWNPVIPRFKGRIGRRLPFHEAANNFGDLIGPALVEEILRRNGLQFSNSAGIGQRLLTVGSILHLAQHKDIVWGSGRNGRITTEKHTARDLDIRMLRGPLTKAFVESIGLKAPNLFGDPALLLGHLFPRLLDRSARPSHEVTFVPNLHDPVPLRCRKWTVHPRGDLWSTIERIASSRFVIASSLHGVIVAEALGIPARLLRSRSEPEFKYADYYLGTGRPDYTPAPSIDWALLKGGERPAVFDTEAMLAAFPIDLFGPAT